MAGRGRRASYAAPAGPSQVRSLALGAVGLRSELCRRMVGLAALRASGLVAAAAAAAVVVAPHNVWKLPRLSIHRFWSSQLKQIAAVLLYPSLVPASRVRMGIGVKWPARAYQSPPKLSLNPPFPILNFKSRLHTSSMFLATDMWRKAFCLLQLGAEVPPPLGQA